MKAEDKNTATEWRDTLGTGPEAAVELLLGAAVGGENLFERGGGNLPLGQVVGVLAAMRHEHLVHELEEMPRHAEAAQGRDEPVFAERVGEEIADADLLAVLRAGGEPGVGDVVEGLAGPLE